MRNKAGKEILPLLTRSFRREHGHWDFIRALETDDAWRAIDKSAANTTIAMSHSGCGDALQCSRARRYRTDRMFSAVVLASNRDSAAQWRQGEGTWCYPRGIIGVLVDRMVERGARGNQQINSLFSSFLNQQQSSLQRKVKEEFSRVHCHWYTRVTNQPFRLSCIVLRDR